MFLAHIVAGCLESACVFASGPSPCVILTCLTHSTLVGSKACIRQQFVSLAELLPQPKLSLSLRHLVM